MVANIIMGVFVIVLAVIATVCCLKAYKIEKELERDLIKYKEDLYGLVKRVNELEIDSKAIMEACEDFYDNEYTPFVEAHEVTSDK